MKLFLCIVFLFAIAFRSFAIDVVDGKGERFSFGKPPHAIAIAPVVTDIIFAIGAEENLLAVSAFSDTKGKSIQKVGSAYGLDWEKIISLNPDVVICSYLNDDSIAERLKKCGIKHIYLHKEGLINIPKDIRLLGGIFGKEKEANAIAMRMENTIKTANFENKYKALFLFGNVAAGRGSFVSDVLNVSGFENCAEKINSPWPVLPREFIVKENPDVIFLTTYDEQSKVSILNTLKSDIAFSSTSAVKNNRIYFVPFNDIILPSVRVVNAIELLRSIRRQMK